MGRIVRTRICTSTGCFRMAVDEGGFSRGSFRNDDNCSTDVAKLRERESRSEQELREASSKKDSLCGNKNAPCTVADCAPLSGN